MNTIDAYAHVGVPRFGSAEEALAMFSREGITRGVLVLGPGVPDLPAVARALHLGGNNVRAMGIPFGGEQHQREELVEAQLAMGISGMRFMPNELESNPLILERLGERGLWLYAINPHPRSSITRLLLEWLNKHPHGRTLSDYINETETCSAIRLT